MHDVSMADVTAFFSARFSYTLNRSSPYVVPRVTRFFESARAMEGWTTPG